MTPPPEPLYAPINNSQEDSSTYLKDGKSCRICGLFLSFSMFTKSRRQLDGYESRCKDCSKSYYVFLVAKHAALQGLSTEKTCTLCHLTKPLNEFYRNTWSPDGRATRCKQCFSFLAAENWRRNPRPPEKSRDNNREWHKKNKDRVVKAHRKRKFVNYGLTEDWYDSTLLAQGGGCAICGTKDPKQYGTFHIDHDHACCGPKNACPKCIRGLLCAGCNTRLGVLEDFTWVQQATAYLESKRPHLD